MTKRVIAVIAVAAIAGAVAAYALRPEDRVPSDAPSLEEMAASVGAPVMAHLVRGHAPGRSGEVMLVPKPNHYMISTWELTTLAGDEPEIKTTHPNPWAYLTEVPIVVRGLDVPEGAEVADPVDISAIAPTFARLLGMDDFESISCSLEEVIACDAQAGVGKDSVEEPPRLIFTVVIDGGGWNLLERYPNAWPNIRRLMDEGITYTEATIGSSPSTTGALHATFGTGFYPQQHGIPGNVLRGDDGDIVDVYLDKETDTRYLQKPAVAEIWDERNDNAAVVGTVSFENWHLGMIGHGAQRTGGDKDIAVLWDREEQKWFVNEDFYTLPTYLQRTDIERLESYEDELDSRDGGEDGEWFGHEIAPILKTKNERPSTPAFVTFTADAVMDILTREDVGADEITDMIWIEMKPPDSAGHAWNMLDPAVGDVLKETDEQIGRFMDELDRTIGRDSYLFVVSADHGQQPLPDDIGGWRINTTELELDIVTRFGDVVQQATPADLYLDADGLRAEGVTAEDIARWLGTYTLGENLPEGAAGIDLVSNTRLDDTLYAGAFTTDFLTDPDLDVAGFGPGEYGEFGDLPVTYAPPKS